MSSWFARKPYEQSRRPAPNTAANNTTSNRRNPPLSRPIQNASTLNSNRVQPARRRTGYLQSSDAEHRPWTASYGGSRAAQPRIHDLGLPRLTAFLDSRKNARGSQQNTSGRTKESTPNFADKRSGRTIERRNATGPSLFSDDLSRSLKAPVRRGRAPPAGVAHQPRVIDLEPEVINLDKDIVHIDQEVITLDSDSDSEVVVQKVSKRTVAQQQRKSPSIEILNVLPPDQFEDINEGHSGHTEGLITHTEVDDNRGSSDNLRHGRHQQGAGNAITHTTETDNNGNKGGKVRHGPFYEGTVSREVSPDELPKGRQTHHEPNKLAASDLLRDAIAATQQAKVRRMEERSKAALAEASRKRRGLPLVHDESVAKRTRSNTRAATNRANDKTAPENLPQVPQPLTSPVFDRGEPSRFLVEHSPEPMQPSSEPAVLRAWRAHSAPPTWRPWDLIQQHKKLSAQPWSAWPDKFLFVRKLLRECVTEKMEKATPEQHKAAIEEQVECIRALDEGRARDGTKPSDQPARIVGRGPQVIVRSWRPTEPPEERKMDEPLPKSTASNSTPVENAMDSLNEPQLEKRALGSPFEESVPRSGKEGKEELLSTAQGQFEEDNLQESIEEGEINPPPISDPLPEGNIQDNCKGETVQPEPWQGPFQEGSVEKSLEPEPKTQPDTEIKPQSEALPQGASQEPLRAEDKDVNPRQVPSPERDPGDLFETQEETFEPNPGESPEGNRQEVDKTVDEQQAPTAQPLPDINLQEVFAATNGQYLLGAEPLPEGGFSGLFSVEEINALVPELLLASNTSEIPQEN